MLNRKAQLQMIVSLGVGIATIAIVLIVAFMVISSGAQEIRDTEGLPSSSDMGYANSTSSALNATYELTDAVGDIPGWLPIIIIAVIGAALLSVVGLLKRQG